MVPSAYGHVPKMTPNACLDFSLDTARVRVRVRVGTVPTLTWLCANPNPNCEIQDSWADFRLFWVNVCAS